ncbi:MAG: hypothetical protein DHS20C12_15860 [Pseudohongiella sp.]|nr:MAG: hypothetical protein DHS20C12_15860 [Pseudohongiella sp.]
MQAKRLNLLHRWTGIVLLLPFVAWSLTGIFFLVRPGYDQAYERIPVQTYELPTALPATILPQWQEIRYFRSILGEHLIVLDDSGWQHLHGESGQPWPLPDSDELSLLLEDAFQFNPQRYGSIISIEDGRADTDTGVRIAVNWSTLSISQNGRDSRWIDRIYSIHYLEWTGFAITDRILGLAGLALLLFMTYTGAVMAFGKKSLRRTRLNTAANSAKGTTGQQ